MFSNDSSGFKGLRHHEMASFSTRKALGLEEEALSNQRPSTPTFPTMATWTCWRIMENEIRFGSRI